LVAVHTFPTHTHTRLVVGFWFGSFWFGCYTHTHTHGLRLVGWFTLVYARLLVGLVYGSHVARRLVYVCRLVYVGYHVTHGLVWVTHTFTLRLGLHGYTVHAHTLVYTRSHGSFPFGYVLHVHGSRLRLRLDYGSGCWFGSTFCGCARLVTVWLVARLLHVTLTLPQFTVYGLGYHTHTRLHTFHVCHVWFTGLHHVTLRFVCCTLVYVYVWLGCRLGWFTVGLLPFTFFTVLVWVCAPFTPAGWTTHTSARTAHWVLPACTLLLPHTRARVYCVFAPGSFARHARFTHGYRTPLRTGLPWLRLHTPAHTPPPPPVRWFGLVYAHTHGLRTRTHTCPAAAVHAWVRAHARFTYHAVYFPRTRLHHTHHYARLRAHTHAHRAHTTRALRLVGLRLVLGCAHTTCIYAHTFGYVPHPHVCGWLVRFPHPLVLVCPVHTGLVYGLVYVWFGLRLFSTLVLPVWFTVAVGCVAHTRSVTHTVCRTRLGLPHTHHTHTPHTARFGFFFLLVCTLPLHFYARFTWLPLPGFATPPRGLHACGFRFYLPHRFTGCTTALRFCGSPRFTRRIPLRTFYRHHAHAHTHYAHTTHAFTRAFAFALRGLPVARTHAHTRAGHHTAARAHYTHVSHALPFHAPSTTHRTTWFTRTRLPHCFRFRFWFAPLCALPHCFTGLPGWVRFTTPRFLRTRV